MSGDYSTHSHPADSQIHTTIQRKRSHACLLSHKAHLTGQVVNIITPLMPPSPLTTSSALRTCNSLSNIALSTPRPTRSCRALLTTCHAGQHSTAHACGDNLRNETHANRWCCVSPFIWSTFTFLLVMLEAALPTSMSLLPYPQPPHTTQHNKHSTHLHEQRPGFSCQR